MEPWTPEETEAGEPLTIEKMEAAIEKIKGDARFIPPCGSEDNPHLAAFDYESGALCAKCGTPLGQESNNQSGTETAQERETAMGSNVERLLEAWENSGMNKIDHQWKSMCRSLREAVEADREEGIEVEVEHNDGIVDYFPREEPEPGDYTLIKREAGN